MKTLKIYQKKQIIKDLCSRQSPMQRIEIEKGSWAYGRITNKKGAIKHFDWIRIESDYSKKIPYMVADVESIEKTEQGLKIEIGFIHVYDIS